MSWESDLSFQIAIQNGLSEDSQDKHKEEVKNKAELHNRFVKGLRAYYDLSDEQIIDVEESWYLCGSRKVKDMIHEDVGVFQEGGHKFTSSEVTSCTTVELKNLGAPEELSFDCRCACGQLLTVNNHWITNGSDIISIGQCCAEQFVKNSKLVCDGCNKHINFTKKRIDRFCSSCRKEMIKKQKQEKKREEEEKKREEEEKREEERIAKLMICKCGRRKKIEYTTCFNCATRCTECGKITNRERLHKCRSNKDNDYTKLFQLLRSFDL